MKSTGSSPAGVGLAYLTLLAALALGSGCSSVRDARIAEIKPGPRCDFTEGATFDNRPSYLSAGQENAPIGALSRLFGVYDKGIHQVTLRQQASRLVARFHAADGARIEAEDSASSRSYSAEGDQLVINRWSSCKPGEAGAGCVWSRVELSCTVDNDLVVKQVGGGAVLLALIIPMGQRNTQFGVYRRIAPAE
ncbi:hypothetical protein [Stenotrophomonas sp. YIM B13575]|uniref:hypothetical protein n=1 Tax=Stenotrophomonas sp. YIM B13575 TaxID=3366314 RepID=UPI00367B760D